MLNVSEIASSTEERVLTGVKASQTMVIDGIKNVMSIADRVVPAPVSDRVEGRVATLPSATPIVEGMFGFAAKVLEAQRDFAGEIVEIFQPAPVKKAPAKKAAAKKSTKKAA